MKPNAFVYRAFDEHDLLLYVGCTGDVAQRLAAHRANGLWAPYLHHMEADGPFLREQALQIEAEAIAAESPFFNAQPEHTAMVQANRVAATQLLHSLGIPGDQPSDDWYIARNAIGRLIEDRFPVVTDREREAAYLAARAAHERRLA